MPRLRGLVSSESLALVSVICIVAIFLGAHYQRQIDSMDQQALKVAQQIYQVLTPAPDKAANAAQAATTTAPPASPQTPREILAKELKAPEGIQVEVLDNSPKAWKVLVWHTKGVVHYLVTPKGVNQEVR